MTTTATHIPTETDVLIVGAGPTGITLAVSLAMLGIDYVVVDKLPTAPDGTRAASVQPRTLEYLRRIGVADGMVEAGLTARGFAMSDLDRDLIRMSYDVIDSPYPFLLLLAQSDTQAHLDRRHEELGGAVLRGVRVLDISPEFPGSAVTLVDAHGRPHVINARYIAGCDGLHSSVRAASGIGFPGASPAQVFAVADVRFDGWPEDRVDTAFSLSPHGMIISSPLPGDMVRFVASVEPGTPAPTSADVAALIESRGAGWMRKGTVGELVSSSTWRVYERVASTFRNGNTFLLGDAAHTHSPAGGQGMNTGIQDAGNLAWKLAHAVSSGDGQAVLDTYDTERRPNAEKLIQFTRQIVEVATITDPPGRQLRNDILAAVADVPGVTRALSDRLSQMNVGYGDSSTPFSPGTRVNPDLIGGKDLSWSLLTPAGPPAHLPPEFTATTSKDVYQPVVVRPDGIVAGPALLSDVFGERLDLIHTS